MIPRLLKAKKSSVLLSTAALLCLCTIADWLTSDNISLAAVYIVPMILGSIVLAPWQIAFFALLCSYLRSWFDVPGTPADLVLRFVFAALAYLACGLFVTSLVRNHQQTNRHLSEMTAEQEKRRQAEEQLRVLAESSPAAIFTVDGDGTVLAANASANRLFFVASKYTLQGRSISEFIPFLGDALRLDQESVGLRAATQAQGYRDNGEIFLAHIWFSSYSAQDGKRLAAIVVDSSEEMRDREEQGLDQLFAGNQIAAMAIAHEVRNVSEAMTMLCEDLRQRHDLAKDDAFCSLDNLVAGLEVIAGLELKPKTPDPIEEVPLREVLDNLRIVVEPAWREIEGTVRWHLPEEVPEVLAEPHGLLQAFLNLSQNSHRAVQEGAARELDITVCTEEQKVYVRFQDSGPGVRDPESLFRPFRSSSNGHGLGLYVSRFIVRSYNGELSFEPQSRGSCFVVELEAA